MCPWNCIVVSDMPRPSLRVLDTLHLALITHCMYYYLVTNYADVSALHGIVWSFKVSTYFRPLAAFSLMTGVTQLQVLFNVNRVFQALRPMFRHFTDPYHIRSTSVSSYTALNLTVS